MCVLFLRGSTRCPYFWWNIWRHEMAEGVRLMKLPWFNMQVCLILSDKWKKVMFLMLKFPVLYQTETIYCIEIIKNKGIELLPATPQLNVFEACALITAPQLQPFLQSFFFFYWGKEFFSICLINTLSSASLAKLKLLFLWQLICIVLSHITFL